MAPALPRSLASVWRCIDPIPYLANSLSRTVEWAMSSNVARARYLNNAHQTRREGLVVPANEGHLNKRVFFALEVPSDKFEEVEAEVQDNGSKTVF